MATRRLAHLAVLTAAALLAPLGGVPGAHATDPAADATAFTGTAYLPDGTTVAKAAVVDLSVAGVRPFARGVSGLDGRFSVDVPETDELVTLALASGGRLTVHWTASDLFPAASVPPPQVSSQTVLGTLHTSPGFAQAAGEFTAYLIDTATGTLADALGNPATMEFRLPDTASGEPIVTTVGDIAAAAGIYNDPDMTAGNEDLDDPDLVPPLNMTLAAVESPLVPVVDAPTCGATAAVNDLGDLVCTPKNGDGAPMWWDGRQCSPVATSKWGADGGYGLPDGLSGQVLLMVLRCTDNNPNLSYYSYGWDAAITPTSNSQAMHSLWRFKVRTEATDPAYDFFGPSFKGNIETDQREEINWRVSVGPVSIPLFGAYAFPPKKMHEWDDIGRDEDGRPLVHISWISGDSANGSFANEGAPFPAAGGWGVVTPQNDDGRSAVHTLHAWTCTYDRRGETCDPH